MALATSTSLGNTSEGSKAYTTASMSGLVSVGSKLEVKPAAANTASAANSLPNAHTPTLRPAMSAICSMPEVLSATSR